VEKWKKVWNTPSSLCSKGLTATESTRKGGFPCPRRSAGARRAAGLVVVTPLDQCLAAYPPSEWSRLEEQLRTLPAFSRPAKALTRLLTSRAVDCELDVQGRILLPAPLRAAAGWSARPSSSAS
jgi:MraZ protein